MSIFQRLYDTLRVGSPVDEPGYDDLGEYGSDESAWQGTAYQDPYAEDDRPARPNNVVGMLGWGSGQTEIVLVEPRSFEEIPQVVSALRERKSVILNLSLMEADAAQRCVDFVAGGVFALDGHQHRIGQTVFLFTPNHTQISYYTSPPPETLKPPMPPVSPWARPDIQPIQ
jgi:cell division inhibitor SepF